MERHAANPGNIRELLNVHSFFMRLDAFSDEI